MELSMSQRNVKILLVDDEKHLRAMYAQELKNHAHFVVTAEDGIDALQKLEEHQNIEILITDLRMPRMNGLQLLEKTYKLYPRLLTMIVTSNRDLESMSKALECGIHDFLDKPVRMDMFAHKVQKAIWHIIRERKRNKILEYLLTTLTNQSMEDFYNMDEAKQGKILDAVQELVCTKLSKDKVKNER